MQVVRTLLTGGVVSMLLLGSSGAAPAADRKNAPGNRLDARVATSRLAQRIGGTRLSAERPAEDERKVLRIRKKKAATSQPLAGKRVRMRVQRMRKTRRVAAMR